MHVLKVLSFHKVKPFFNIKIGKREVVYLASLFFKHSLPAMDPPAALWFLFLCLSPNPKTFVQAASGKGFL